MNKLSKYLDTPCNGGLECLAKYIINPVILLVAGATIIGVPIIMLLAIIGGFTEH